MIWSGTIWQTSSWLIFKTLGWRDPQEVAVSSAQLHPEFGYFCPSLRVRRVLWAALVLAFFGLIAGAGGIRPFVSHDDDIDNRVMPAHASPAGGNERLVQADGPPRPEARPQPTRATVGKVDTPRSDPAKMCEEMTWA